MVIVTTIAAAATVLEKNSVAKYIISTITTITTTVKITITQVFF